MIGLNCRSAKDDDSAIRPKRDLRGLEEPTLSGYTVQLSTGVKYLGLIPDKGLTWKAQLEKYDE